MDSRWTNWISHCWKRVLCYQSTKYDFLIKKNIFILIKIVLDTLPYLDKIAQKYSSPMRLWFGSKMLIFIADAENAEIVLKSKDCLNKPDIFYNVIRDSMCVDGILTSEGE